MLLCVTITSCICLTLKSGDPIFWTNWLSFAFGAIINFTTEEKAPINEIEK